MYWVGLLGIVLIEVGLLQFTDNNGAVAIIGFGCFALFYALFYRDRA